MAYSGGGRGTGGGVSGGGVGASLGAARSAERDARSRSASRGMQGGRGAEHNYGGKTNRGSVYEGNKKQEKPTKPATKKKAAAGAVVPKGLQKLIDRERNKRSTILTGGQGVLEEAPVSRKKLLGG